MKTTQALEKFRVLKASVDTVVKTLDDMARLAEDTSNNVYRLAEKVDVLQRSHNQLKEDLESTRDFGQSVGEDKEYLADLAEKVRKCFGAELEEQLRPLKITVSGQYPELRAGWFTLELDASQGMVKIWYGPKHDYLMRCRMSVKEVTDYIKETQQTLGSHLDKEEYLARLRKAYLNTADGKRGEAAPIMEVFDQLKELMVPTEAEQEGDQRSKSYRRADYSYDLFEVTPCDRMHLTVSTRAYTKTKRGFLWIPDTQRGNGTTYSHLQFKEND